MNLRCCIQQGLAPGLLLAVLPKCPLCLAALIGVVFGAQVSMEAAILIRTFLVLVCCGAIGFVFARSLPVLLKLRFRS